MKKLLVVLAVIALVLALLPFVAGDREVNDLNDETRKGLGMRFIKLTDGMVHFDIQGPGKGATVVLVHGNAAPFFSWEKNLKSLTDSGFRVLTYDLYGFGYSDRPDTVYSRALYDRQLSELLERLNIRGPVNLVGTSQGGSIAVNFTASHPERVKRLALLSPFVNALPMKVVIGLMRVPGIGEYLMRVLLDRVNVNYPQKVFADTGAIPGEYTEQYLKQLSYRGFKRARLSNLRSDSLRDFTEQYKKVGEMKMPVLLTWGTADKVIMADSIEIIRKSIPRLRYHEIDGGGHVVHYENPEKVNGVLVDFLKR
jgi:pimeloyl-ACP methyl ester carboxylesterase